MKHIILSRTAVYSIAAGLTVLCLNNQALALDSGELFAEASFTANLINATQSTASSASQVPTAPENLRRVLYSDSALELFWDRASSSKTDDSYVTGYEIYRNDTLIDVTGIVTSYFDKGLVNAESYNYTVRSLRGSVAGGASSLRETNIDIGDDGSAFTPPAPPTLPTLSGPPAPSNLRSRVYSSRSAEIFWDRAAIAKTKYDVYRNGQQIEQGIYGLSVYESSLSPGTSYTYDVFAYTNGAKSAATSMTLTTPHSSSTATPTVQAPENLSLTRYSSNALEIFWKRPSTTAGIKKFEIYRNNQLVRTTTGISYFDSAANRSTQWVYSVLAIDGSGNRSNKVNVTAN